MANWKLGAAGLLSAGLVAAGAGVLAQPPGDHPGAEAPALPADPAGSRTSEPSPISEPGSEPASALPPTRVANLLPSLPGSTTDDPFAAGRAGAADAPPEEIAARLDLAESMLAVARLQRKQGIAPDSKYREAVAEVAILRARVSAAIADLDDEIELLKLQLQARILDVKTAESEVARARVLLEHADRINAKDPNSITPAEVRRAETEINRGPNRVEGLKLGITEAEIRLRQATRRRDRWAAIPKAGEAAPAGTSDEDAAGTPRPPEPD